MQTLAYMLPVLSLALRKAEAEFEQLANMGKAYTAGMLHVATLLHYVLAVYTLPQESRFWLESHGGTCGGPFVHA